MDQKEKKRRKKKQHKTEVHSEEKNREIGETYIKTKKKEKSDS